jgi:hypothetical protein
VLTDAKINTSMDGKERWIDDRMIERLWRSLKYECVYLHAFETGSEATAGIEKWLAYYNVERPHSTHEILTPDEAYASKTEPMRLAGLTETLIHFKQAANWSNYWDHLCLWKSRKCLLRHLKRVSKLGSPRPIRHMRAAVLFEHHNKLRRKA